MALFFWDAKEILLIDYLEQGKTITREYYASLLDRMKTAITEKRPRMAKKRCCLQKLTNLRFELLPHLVYSLDPAPSDFHLFRKLKTFLAGQTFVCNEEAIQAINNYFEGLEENHFREGIGNLEKR